MDDDISLSFRYSLVISWAVVMYVRRYDLGCEILNVLYS